MGEVLNVASGTVTKNTLFKDGNIDSQTNPPMGGFVIIQCLLQSHPQWSMPFPQIPVKDLE